LARLEVYELSAVGQSLAIRESKALAEGGISGLGMEFERWKPYFLALRLLGNFCVLQDFLNLEYQRCSIQGVNRRGERVQRNENYLEALVVSGDYEDVGAMLGSVCLLAGDSSNRLGHYPLVRVLSMVGKIKRWPPAH
jgi:hypothetical protein